MAELRFKCKFVFLQNPRFIPLDHISVLRIKLFSYAQVLQKGFAEDFGLHL